MPHHQTIALRDVTLTAGSHITTAELERCIATKAWRDGLPAAIEAEFSRYRYNRRVTWMRANFWPTVIIYNIFLAADFLVLPDTAWIATLLHGFVVTPLIVLTYFLYPRVSNAVVRKLADATVSSAIFVQIMVIFALNGNDAAAHYQFLAVPVLIEANINQRSGYKAATLQIIGLLIVYAVLIVASAVDTDVKLIGLAVMTTTAYITLNANRRLERDGRYAFLHHLMDRAKFQDAERSAMVDELTGVKNRRYLRVFLASMFDGTGLAQLPLAAIMIDIDHFKSYNDFYGHGRGDDCLSSVARTIDEALQLNEAIAIRYGGEEFLVLMPGADEAAALICAEAIRSSVEARKIENPRGSASPYLTVSIGVAVAHASRETCEILISTADAALYAAKAGGRNRVQSAHHAPVFSDNQPFLFHDLPVTLRSS
jgi:diguanylate cyclase (GGDEF)-like protein